MQTNGPGRLSNNGGTPSEAEAGMALGQQKFLIYLGPEEESTMQKRVLWQAMILATPVSAVEWPFTLLPKSDVDRPPFLFDTSQSQAKNHDKGY